MNTPPAETPGHPPSRAVSLALTALLIIAWGLIRLVVFDTVMFPLTYVLPMLLCVWTRDRLALWVLAVSFAAMHTVKLVWLLPPGSLDASEWWANYSGTMLNIALGIAVVTIIIGLRDRLDLAMNRARAQSDELREQAEELAQQNEELSVQGEELGSQNEELQQQAEEITLLNTALERREALLQALLETTRVSGSEAAALDQIVSAAIDLFGPSTSSVTIFEALPDRDLRRLAVAPAGPSLDERVDDALVRLVLEQQKTAGLDDVRLRPDLTLAPDGVAGARAVLCAPIRVDGTVSACVHVSWSTSHAWTDEEFRMAEWLADQCGRIIAALRVQADLREMDRRKSEFLAVLSHELRNPLAPISYALTLLETHSGREDKALPVMRRQVGQLVRLVDDLLDVTRLTSSKIQVRPVFADLTPIVQHAVDAVRPEIEERGHTVTICVPDQPVWINVDPVRMSQVVTNLLNNAARYTPAGGRVTVSLNTDGTDATLSVIDTGIGLSASDMDRVFEMFTQIDGPSSGGLGIGLALVRGIVELHGGRVHARSDGPGRGCEFSVVLPLMTEAASLGAGGAMNHEATAGLTTKTGMAGLHTNPALRDVRT